MSGTDQVPMHREPVKKKQAAATSENFNWK